MDEEEEKCKIFGKKRYNKSQVKSYNCNDLDITLQNVDMVQTNIKRRVTMLKARTMSNGVHFIEEIKMKQTYGHFILVQAITCTMIETYSWNLLNW